MTCLIGVKMNKSFPTYVLCTAFFKHGPLIHENLKCGPEPAPCSLSPCVYVIECGLVRRPGFWELGKLCIDLPLTLMGGYMHRSSAHREENRLFSFIHNRSVGKLAWTLLGAELEVVAFVGNM